MVKCRCKRLGGFLVQWARNTPVVDVIPGYYVREREVRDGTKKETRRWAFAAGKERDDAYRLLFNGAVSGRKPI